MAKKKKGIVVAVPLPRASIQERIERAIVSLANKSINNDLYPLIQGLINLCPAETDDGNESIRLIGELDARLRELLLDKYIDVVLNQRNRSLTELNS